MTTASPSPVDLDSLLLQWADGDRQAVARSILSMTIPDAIRTVLAIRAEYASIHGDIAGSVIDGEIEATNQAVRLLQAIDAEHAELTAGLAG